MLQSPSLLERFFTYLIKPQHLDQIPKNSFWRKLWDSFRLYNFAMIFVILGSIITTLIITQLDSPVENEVSNLATEFNIWLFFVLAVIYAPLAEEVAFRLWLRATPWNLAFGLSFLLNTAISLLSSYNLIPLSQILDDVYINILDAFQISLNSEFFEALGRLILGLVFALSLMTAMTIWLYILFRSVPKITQAIHHFYEKFFGPIFYLSAITFGLIHIGNYSGIEQIWWVGPLLVIPQLVAGVELGYIRVHWGIWWAILIHALNNFVPFLLFFSFTFFSDPVREVMFSGDTSGAETADLYTTGDTLLILLIFLGFIVGALILIAINVFNIVELIISLLKHNKSKSKPNQTLVES